MRHCKPSLEARGWGFEESLVLPKGAHIPERKAGSSRIPTVDLCGHPQGVAASDCGALAMHSGTAGILDVLQVRTIVQAGLAGKASRLRD